MFVFVWFVFYFCGAAASEAEVQTTRGWRALGDVLVLWTYVFMLISSDLSQEGEFPRILGLFRQEWLSPMVNSKYANLPTAYNCCWKLRAICVCDTGPAGVYLLHNRREKLDTVRSGCGTGVNCEVRWYLCNRISWAIQLTYWLFYLRYPTTGRQDPSTRMSIGPDLIICQAMWPFKILPYKEIVHLQCGILNWDGSLIAIRLNLS